MTFKLLGILTPLFKDIDLSSLEESGLSGLNVTQMSESLFKLSEDDFRFIQDNCLQVVEELLGAGPQKVLDKYGKWGVNDIECDAALVMNLTIQSLVFNVTGFFKGSLLSSITNKLTTFQQASKI
jgi:hypothetical protein